MGVSRTTRATIVAMFLAMASLAACDPVASTVVSGPTAPTGNVADQMVRIAVAVAGIRPPFEVVEIRQGQIDELSGLTAVAEAAASVTTYATDDRSLVRKAWRVRIIGATCADDCVSSRVFVETIIDAQDARVISVRMTPVPAGLATPAP